METSKIARKIRCQREVERGWEQVQKARSNNLFGMSRDDAWETGMNIQRHAAYLTNQSGRHTDALSYAGYCMITTFIGGAIGSIGGAVTGYVVSDNSLWLGLVGGFVTGAIGLTSAMIGYDLLAGRASSKAAQRHNKRRESKKTIESI